MAGLKTSSHPFLPGFDAFTSGRLHPDPAPTEPSLANVAAGGLDRVLVPDGGGIDSISQAPEKIAGKSRPVFVGQFWTAKQRDGHSIHEISYRACYKPALPAFFIKRFTEPGGVVYDPFMGRGTTLVEANLLGRRTIGNDINPLSHILAAPRLAPPRISDILESLRSIELPEPTEIREDLHVFFHPDTLREIEGWRLYFKTRKAANNFDHIDSWLQMVAANRLTGHSVGFFSVYTLPPNQATSIKAQQRINEKRSQVPTYRDTRKIMAKKSRSLLSDPWPQSAALGDAQWLNGSAESTPRIPDDSVDLVVTSPPFVDIVDYATDNWMRMWFCGVEPPAAKLWQIRSVDQWAERMAATLSELRRVLRPDGWIAFEVGEVRKSSLPLEEHVVAAADAAGLRTAAVIIHSHVFTKTAHCWGVSNNRGGTNSNRVVLLRKDVLPA